MFPVSRRLQGAVHEPTSTFFNRAGAPREGVGVRTGRMECSIRDRACLLNLLVRCRSWSRSFRKRSWWPAAQSPRSSHAVLWSFGDSFVRSVSNLRAMDATTTRLLRSSIANIPGTVALSWMPSPLLWAGLEPSNFVGLVLQLSTDAFVKCLSMCDFCKQTVGCWRSCRSK